MKSGKTPGPDGIGIEFYKKFWHVIGDQFTVVMNEFINGHYEHKNFKQGYITLIFKNSNPRDIKNYRPISLLNVDYKIISKVYANRIKCVLSDLLGPMQYAVKGRDVANGLVLLRDVIDFAQKNNHETYVLSLDFYKAFDCVDHCFLQKVLKQSGFSHTFCDHIFTLLQNSETAVIVNGFISDFFPVKRGVRQGDPLSFHLFLLFLEPMLKSIMRHDFIDGVFLPGSKGFNMKYFAYADDVTLTLLGTYSISRAFELLDNFGKATGLKLNYKKLNGLVCCKGGPPICCDSNVKWKSDFIEVLNLPFGSKREISRIFSQKICQVKTEIFRVKKARTTYDAKAVIIKMKIMPILSFLVRVYCFPSSMINRLNRIVLNYVLPKSCSLTIYELSKSRDSGGYDILDIPLFLELLTIVCQTSKKLLLVQN